MCGSVIVNQYSFSLLVTSCMDSLPKMGKPLLFKYIQISRLASDYCPNLSQVDLLPCDRLCGATIPPTWPIAFSLHYFEPLDIACTSGAADHSVCTSYTWGLLGNGFPYRHTGGAGSSWLGNETVYSWPSSINLPPIASRACKVHVCVHLTICLK